MNGEAQGMEGNSAVGIDRSCEPETEDSIQGLVWFGHDKRPEEHALFPQSVSESRMWDLSGGGVNPFESILGEFPVEHLPCLLDLRDSVSDARAHQVILNPTIGSLDLALGGRT